MSTTVTVDARGDGSFDVQVRQGGITTGHVVSVPAALAEELGCPEVSDHRLVEVSFDFLLEREPATSILPSFGLEVIERYFPEYRQEMARRLA